MARKKNRAKFPKRLLGVKIPRRFRRFADSPVGAQIVGAAVLSSAYAAWRSERVQAAVMRVREEVAGLGQSLRARSRTDDNRYMDDPDERLAPN